MPAVKSLDTILGGRRDAHRTTRAPRLLRLPALSLAGQRRNPYPMKFNIFGNNTNRDRNEPPPQQQHARPSSSGQEFRGASGSGAAGPLPPSAAFPQLATMSTADLEKAALENVAFEKLLARAALDPSATAAVGGALTEASALRQSNAELARATLAGEGQLEETRRQIAIVRSTEYDAARAAFEEKFARQEAAREVVAPERLIERLQAAAGAAEGDATALEQQFRAGKVPLEEFVERYTALKAVYHARDMKYQAALQTIPTARPPAGLQR